MQIKIERNVGENAFLCKKSSSPVCKGVVKAVKMLSYTRIAARVNVDSDQRQRKCILKNERRARMLMRSKGEKMPLDAWKAVCEYRYRGKSEKMCASARRAARQNAKGVKKL